MIRRCKRLKTDRDQTQSGLDPSRIRRALPSRAESPRTGERVDRAPLRAKTSWCRSSPTASRRHSQLLLSVSRVATVRFERWDTTWRRAGLGRRKLPGLTCLQIAGFHLSTDGTISCRRSSSVRCGISRLTTIPGVAPSHARAVERGIPRFVAMKTSPVRCTRPRSDGHSAAAGGTWSA